MFDREKKEKEAARRKESIRIGKIISSKSKCFEDMNEDTIAGFLERKRIFYTPDKKKLRKKSSSSEKTEKVGKYIPRSKENWTYFLFA